MSYVLKGRPYSLKKIRDDFESFIKLLESEGINQIGVYFGFAWLIEVQEKGWGRPLDSPRGAREQVKRAERETDGFLGYDNLVLEIKEFSYEKFYGHDFDVQITSEVPTQYTEEQKRLWIADGWDVREKIAGKWRDAQI
ncbi:MAG: hypothetical protein GY841_03190 [FCB group bacterium]|nr:hypothetical protein [FCB group bacterium]